MIPCVGCRHCISYGVKPGKELDQRKAKEVGIEVGEGIVLIDCDVADIFMMIPERYLSSSESAKCEYLEFVESVDIMPPETAREVLYSMYDRGVVGYETLLSMVDEVYGPWSAEAIDLWDKLIYFFWRLFNGSVLWHGSKK